MQTFTAQQSTAFFLLAAQAFEDALDELSRLDAAIGDGDHGVSMVKGFRSIAAMVTGSAFADIGTQWMESGKILMKEIGGTCGPLFATIFMKGGMVARGKTELTTAELAKMIKDGNDGIKTMGKAAPGDKTMVDALEPAALALIAAAAENMPGGSGIAARCECFQSRAEATKQMLATRGRGRYQGENSLGHQDAGATSVSILFRALADAAR